MNLDEMAGIKRKSDRINYYVRNILLDLLTSIISRKKLYSSIEEYLGYDQKYIKYRINYYNKISEIFELPSDAAEIRAVSIEKSMYYYDFKEIARHFSSRIRVNYEFGDVTEVPGVPSFVKSRPIHRDNRNSLIMNLEKFRHFYFPPDHTPFNRKKPIAVWRGGGHNPKRVELIRRYRDHPLCDIGFTHAKAVVGQSSPFLHPTEQMAFKYVISIEGNDVATNLKWILSSDSLCLMPVPAFETWFMEGRLVAGEHYVPLADDFEDLEDKILYYERHPDEAQEIIRNANRYVDQFFDARRERAIGLLVMYKYFIATRQIEPDETIAEMIWP